ncbi:MAG TPA: hypothetical protein VMI56_15270 [Reyranella sp.]|nr:hypothetical protein [Reyranella sp.]
MAKFLRISAVLLVLGLVTAELALRLQQWLGPVYDLETRGANMDWYSDVVNHKAPRHLVETFKGKEVYGALAGFSYVLEFDDHGVRQPVSKGTAATCAKTVSILFMGDSVIQGYDVPHSPPDLVAQRLAEKHGICSTIYNTGSATYSPALFVPLARQLIPILKPDYVVVDIDETDIGDDVDRYEGLITRNAAGENVGVRATPGNIEISQRLIAIRSRALYLRRLVEKMYVMKVVIPRVDVQYDLYRFSRDHEPALEIRYAKELAIFRRNLAELIDVLGREAGAGHVIFIHHPHLENLAPDPKDGRIWNDIVSSTVEKVAAEHGALFFDTTAELRRAFAGHPKDFYWASDRHFTFEAQRLYSDSVTEFLAKHID